MTEQSPHRNLANALSVCRARLETDDMAVEAQLGGVFNSHGALVGVDLS